MTGTTTGSRSTGVGTPTDESVADKAKSAAGTATDKAKETGSELTHKATEQVGTVAHRVADKADERKGELATTARTMQDKMREFATSVGEEQPKVGETLEKVVDSAGQLISYVERTPVEQMTHDLSDQMRRRPLLFAVGMFGAGFALTRVLKPVDPSLASSNTGTRQLGQGSNSQFGQGSTSQLPAASALDGGMH